MLFSLLSRTRIKGVVGALLAQMLGKQCLPGLATTILFVAFVLWVSLHLLAPACGKTSGAASGDECLRQEKKPLAFPNSYPHTKACLCLDGAPLTIHGSSMEPRLAPYNLCLIIQEKRNLFLWESL